MDAKEFVNRLKDPDRDRLVHLAHYDGEDCDGRGWALIVDAENSIAVMLGPCGQVRKTKVTRGAIVKFWRHPEGEPRIVGEPAYAVPINENGVALR